MTRTTKSTRGWSLFPLIIFATVGCGAGGFGPFGAGGGSGGGGGGGGGGQSQSGPCAGTMAWCGNSCVDTQADLANCGSCGRTCTGQGQICNHGTCETFPTDCTQASSPCGPGYACSPSTRHCESGCRLSSDCPSGASCTMTGACSCGAGQHACGQVCVDSDSVASCGSRCQQCPAPSANGTAACVSGSCSYACAAGFEPCDSGCCVGPTIKATVDGTPSDFSLGAYGYATYTATSSSIIISNGVSTIRLAVVGGDVGRYSCAASTASITMGSQQSSYAPSAPCQIQIDVYAGSGGRIQGTFSGTVASPNGSGARVITAGTFDVPMQY